MGDFKHMNNQSDNTMASVFMRRACTKNPDLPQDANLAKGIVSVYVEAEGPWNNRYWNVHALHSLGGVGLNNINVARTPSYKDAKSYASQLAAENSDIRVLSTRPYVALVPDLVTGCVIDDDDKKPACSLILESGGDLSGFTFPIEDEKVKERAEHLPPFGADGSALPSVTVHKGNVATLGAANMASFSTRKAEQRQEGGVSADNVVSLFGDHEKRLEI